MAFEAEPARTAESRSLDWHEARLPARGKDGSIRSDPLRVPAVDEIGALGVVLGVDVRLHRHREISRRIRGLSEDGLAADDDDLVILRDHGTRVIATPPMNARARAIEERRIGSEPLGDGTVQSDAALLGLRMRRHAEEFSTRFSAPERSGSA